MSLEAVVVYEGVRDNEQEIELKRDGKLIHRLQIGGAGGDGFCYEHQSFDCLDNLSPEEKTAIDEC